MGTADVVDVVGVDNITDEVIDFWDVINLLIVGAVLDVTEVVGVVDINNEVVNFGILTCLSLARS